MNSEWYWSQFVQDQAFRGSRGQRGHPVEGTGKQGAGKGLLPSVPVLLSHCKGGPGGLLFILQRIALHGQEVFGKA